MTNSATPNKRRYVDPPATRELEVLAMLWGWVAFISGGLSAVTSLVIATGAIAGLGSMGLYVGLVGLLLSPMAGLPASTVAAGLRSRIRMEDLLARSQQQPTNPG